MPSMLRTLILPLVLASTVVAADSLAEKEKATDMNDAEQVFQLAQWCAENRQPTKAGQLYARVVKLDPNHFGARQARGEVLVGDRWVNKSFAPKSAGGSAEGGTGTTAGSPAAAGPGPAAKDVSWDLSIPKDPTPGPNDFVDGLIERMRTSGNDSDPMARAVATLVREDNWPTALPRLCAALAKPGFGDVYGASDILIELNRAKRSRDAKRLLPFIVRASADVSDAEDLTHLALSLVDMRERKTVPRLIELLAHADKNVQDAAREALAATTRLPARDLTVDKAKAWWNANWSAGEDQVLMAQLKGSDALAAVEAADALANMRNPEIFPVLFKHMRSEDPMVMKRAVAVLKRAATMDWGIAEPMTPEQRLKRIELAEKWWKDERPRFRWPGIKDEPVDAGSTTAAVVADPSRDDVAKLASTTGTEAQDAEGRLRQRGTQAVPALLDALANPSSLTRRRAHDILREIGKQDFGFDPRADEAARQKAIDAWKAWAVSQKLVVEEDAEPAEGAQP